MGALNVSGLGLIREGFVSSPDYPLTRPSGEKREVEGKKERGEGLPAELLSFPKCF